MKRRDKITLWALTGLVLVALLYSVKSFTPPLFDHEAVAELRSLEVNGDKQYVLIRGRDRAQPVLLFLHGGPGMPAMYLAHAFQRRLESEFVVVHWDQRASGKSYRKGIDPETLTISNLLADTEVVVDFLRDYLGTERVWILGHSHGSYVGALYARRNPDSVRAFVGVGQLADFERETEVQDTFLRSRLEELGLPPDTVISGANREDLLFATGSELYGETSFLPLVLTGLGAMEYSLMDIMKVAQGSSFSSANMTYDVSRDLIGAERDFQVPVAMIMGEYDMTTPVSLAREYFEVIEAPDKAFYLVEDSAHFPHYERPDRFHSILVELKNRWGSSSQESSLD